MTAPADGIRAEIEALRSGTPEASALTPEHDRQILADRARELARGSAGEASQTDFIEAVEFELGGERYAFELRSVREVSLLRELTPVPCTPPFISGIINVRGEILTVIDIKKLFGLPEIGITELNRVIVIREGALQLGILADAIHEVRRIPPAALQSGLPTLTGMRADFLKGVTGERLILLDAGKILSDPRIVIYEEAGG